MLFFFFQFVFLVNAKSSQMTNIYADIVHITKPMVFPNIWRALYVECMFVSVIFLVVAEEKCEDFWYLHISNQIVR